MRNKLLCAIIHPPAMEAANGYPAVQYSVQRRDQSQWRTIRQVIDEASQDNPSSHMIIHCIVEASGKDDQKAAIWFDSLTGPMTNPSGNDEICAKTHSLAVAAWKNVGIPISAHETSFVLTLTPRINACIRTLSKL